MNGESEKEKKIEEDCDEGGYGVVGVTSYENLKNEEKVCVEGE